MPRIRSRFRVWLDESSTLRRREFYGVFAVLFLLVTIAFAGLGRLALSNRDRAREGEEAHAVGCARKLALIERIIDGEDAFTKPDLVERLGNAGITPALIRRGIERDRTELRATLRLTCAPSTNLRAVILTKGTP